MNRTRHTQDTVGDALVSLMRERPYGEIRVEDVVNRADISRSTFYSHFDGKDDLLASHFAHFFDFIAEESMRRDGQNIRIAPVELMLNHLADARYRDFYRALTGSGKMLALRAIAIERLSSKFESELLQLARGRTPRIPAPLAAHFIATTFMDLVDWWVQNDAPYSPKEMESIFHRMVTPAIEHPSVC
jgi:AcrR family transcriptional regulator